MKRKKEVWFKLFFLILPILFFITIELSLRLFNLFSQEQLFKEIERNGTKYYQLNPYIAKRYFDPQKVTLPTLYPETFSHQKSDKTFRIFCLGGSTTAGFPFEYQVPFPHQLKNILKQTYPDCHFEVINMGLSAVNSFTVLDLLPDILDKEPDLILIYMGHNEFYGAYGSASTFSIGQNGSFIRLYMNLKNLHLVNMVKSIIKGILPAPAKPGKSATLMESMIAGKTIGYQSDKYKTTLENYKDNLNIIMEECNAADIPVIIGSLFSNLKTHPPFSSESLATNNSKILKKISVELQIADSLFKIKEFENSTAHYLNIIQLDSVSAQNWYNLGMAYYYSGDSLKAKRYLTGAKDRDIIRFRASNEMNNIIKNTAKSCQAEFVDLAQLISQHSPYQISDETLVCDHLHPNPIGYDIMAQGFAIRIIQSGMIKKSKLNNFKNPTIITDLDWNIGLIKIYKLIHSWPFANKKVNYSLFKPFGNKHSGQIAYNYVFKDNHWVNAHYNMADEYLKNKETDKVRLEYMAINSYDPEYYDSYIKIAGTYEKEKKWKASELYYKKALPRISKTGFINFHLALVQWQQKKIEPAINNIQKAIVSKDLSPQLKLQAKYHLAGFLTQIKKTKDAVFVLNDILKQNPDFKPAQKLLRQVTGNKLN